MDKMTVRMPVAIKAKVTETLKTKIIGDLQKRIQQINLDLEQFEFTAKRALNEQENQDESLIPALKEQIDVERSKRFAAKQEAEAKLKRAEKLEYGAEVGHGQLERTVELEIGTDIDKLMGAEIVTEDGKIVAFRA
ncbi:MAG: 16S rRNA processing protein RimM [Negativicutes bacterium]|nr:16S rRNA processing protein RimM [Negativicutes bacterium]